MHLVGNVMIDVLQAELPRARALDQPAKLGLQPAGYVLWTMHRASNVDDRETLGRLCAALVRVASRIPVVFPVHPRSKARLEAAGLWATLMAAPGVTLTPPLGYLEFLGLSSHARIVVTDSGGLQEESTVLGIPCLTLRENTERPITVTEGTSTLVGHDIGLLEAAFEDVLAGRYKRGAAPTLWDGHAGERIAYETAKFLELDAPAPSYQI
jgi:UDP-N-acetylglucosamine 2-epimerase (non-hydrolysing)